MHFQAKSLTSFDNTKIYYEINHSNIKHRRTLIFLHGLGGDLADWSDEKKYFSKLGYKVIVLDMRGHGLSERKENFESYKFDCFVEDIVSLIKHEKLKKPVLIGHCFGGMVTMILAGKYPEIALPVLALGDLTTFTLFVLSIGMMVTSKFLPGIYGNF